MLSLPSDPPLHYQSASTAQVAQPAAASGSASAPGGHNSRADPNSGPNGARNSQASQSSGHDSESGKSQANNQASKKPGNGGNKKQQKQPPKQTVKSHGYEYFIVDNDLLKPATIEKVVKGAKNPRAAVGALKKAYQKQGYFLVALVGRERGHRVLLHVVEGRLTHVKGSGHMPWFFSGLKGNKTITNSDVIRRATLAQAYDATNGQQPQIRFKPAPEAGGSTMKISQNALKNYQPVGASFTFGNFGNRYASRYLVQGQAYLKSHGFTLQAHDSYGLTGMSSNTKGAYYNSPGVDLSYVTPWGIYKLDYSHTKYQLGKAFAPLYPLGRITRYGLSGTQLLYADARSRWTLQEGFHHITDQETVFHGAYTLRDQHYFVFKLGSDFNRRFGGLFNRPASLSVGGDMKFGSPLGTHSGFPPSGGGNPVSDFKLYSGHASLTQVLPRNFRLKLDVSGQMSPNTLPEYQQWVLGGLNNLTAYLPGTIVGDRGYLTRLSAESPTWHAGPFTVSSKAFVEHGAARYSFVPKHSHTWQSATDIGASLSLNLPLSKTSATVAYAHPVSTSHVSHATRHNQSAGVFFYLSQSF